MITAAQLATIAPKSNSQAIAPLLSYAMTSGGVDTPIRQAMLLGQACWESDEFTEWEEDLSQYTAVMLMRDWPHLFPASKPVFVQAYVGKPELIANRAYGSRFGNGDELSGDGWKYRGRGPTGLTFKDNYQEFGDRIGTDLVTYPELAAQYETGCKILVAYWNSKGLSALADARDIKAITKKIEGDFTYGDPSYLERRVAYTNRAIGALGAGSPFPVDSRGHLVETPAPVA